ncbi:MAG: AAA+ family ATPase, partial [Chloroflexia bacterium]|nr:AAA+ family ATPase [Chloroflexia bacterium]
RGDSPRLNRNTLVFAAADTAKWVDLEAAVRQYLAWDSIHREEDPLNLDAFQRNQAKTKQAATNTTVDARLADTYLWILFPRQEAHSRSVDWDELRTMGDGELARRVSQRLRNDGLLHTRWNGVSLKQWLDRVPLWRGDAVSIKELASFFAQYLYLDKLRNDQVLLEAIADGLNNSMWMTETFALASAYDDATGRYHGLVHGRHQMPTLDQMLVKPEVALRQIQHDQQAQAARDRQERDQSGDTDQSDPGTAPDRDGSLPKPPPQPPLDRKTRRYFAQVRLDPEQIATETGKLSAEILQHLVGVLGASVTVTLEIEAVVPDGIPEAVRRTVDENSRTLKFEQHGFEES